jgi:hypothetical protein
MDYNGHEDYTISFDTGADLTKRYRDQMTSGQLKGGFIGRDSMLDLLNQEGCIGFRYYYGLNSNGKQEVVFVGVDTNGNDMIGTGKICIDTALPCPTYCGNNNVLNS